MFYRFKVSEEQLAILKEYWGKGMRNTRSEEAVSMLKEVIKKTGMEKKQVQVIAYFMWEWDSI